MAASAKPVVREKRDIEALVIWALIDNGLGAEFEDKAGRLTWRDYGTRIQSGSGGWAASGPRLQHDDALRIADAILGLPLDPESGQAVMGELVVRHARTNCRPDWCEEGVGHSELKRNKRGQVEWHYERPGDTKSRKLSEKRIWVGETQASVDYFRARYAVWWIALKLLAEALGPVLERFEPTGPRAPERPWDGARVFGPDGEVLTGMRGEDASQRLAGLKRRGDLEMDPPEPGNIHIQESASSGAMHGRS